jgi:hypothetical protein
MDLNATIEMLIRNPATYRPAFPYERAIRIYQFQAWIYFPEPSMVELAGSLAAAKYLISRQYKLLDDERPVNSTDLISLLKDKEYGKLYDATIGEYGGWSHLVHELQQLNFRDQIDRRIETVETVCEMIDYRFRYLDHDGSDKRLANISHGEFYRWKRAPKLSYKTIRERWKKNRRSAVFLYVSEKLGLRLCPRFKALIFGGASTDATKIRRIRRFFGICAYVSEKLREDHADIEDDVQIPKSVRRVRPTTEPLSDSDIQSMSSYRAERDTMRAS